MISPQISIGGNMVLRVLDPSPEINKAPEGKPMRILEGLEGKRTGLLWGRHAGSIKFWPVMEEVVQAKFKPVDTVKLYKRGTWNPASDAEIEEMAGKVDFAIIGVGA